MVAPAEAPALVVAPAAPPVVVVTSSGVEQAAQPTNAAPTPPPVAAPVAAPMVAPVVKPVPADAGNVGKNLGFQPVEAPPPPISAQKQAELKDLLAKYMANQVTPEEYHKARAAILAEP
jgi:hypothetical protein